MTANGLQLTEVGDYEAQNFHLLMNLIRTTNVELTTETLITYTPCYRSLLN